VSLRSKLLLAQLPLGFSLLLLGAIALATSSHLAKISQHILRDNYRSVLAAQRMKESIERMDSAAMFVVAGQRQRATQQAAEHRPRFEAELAVEESNVTEPGESELAARLRQHWTDYLRKFEEFASLPAGTTPAGYFRDIEPRFLVVKETAQRILDVNQDAMVERSDAAKRTSDRLILVMGGVSILAFIVGWLASVWLTTRLLIPLDSLSQAVQRLGEDDADIRAAVIGNDEVAALAGEFNQMAAKLARYRNSAKGQLLQAQRASQAAIDSIPYPVLVMELGGQIVSLNKSSQALLVPTSDPPTLSLIDPPLRSAIEAVTSHVLAGKGAYVPRGFQDAVKVPTSSGDRFLLPRANPMYSDAGPIAGVTVVLQDVTRLRRFDELKNDLVATVAHEFRTPLTSLHLAIHLCVEEKAGPITAGQADLLHAARHDCERLQGIVDDLLNLARLQAGKGGGERTEVSPRAMVEAAAEAHQGLAEQRSIQLSTQVDPVIEAVSADPESIHRVLSNLVSNALRHTKAGGTVTLRASNADELVRFEVVDSGEGIAPEHKDRVFDRFFKVPGASTDGSGLGLAIAKEIVQSHAGRIGVESEPGKGSLFWFTLPVVK
jgi:NtrC-family two-component system sensor histidine kinase KinB